MPFISKDWRSPGETWVKTHEGWEKKKVLECTSPAPAKKLTCRSVTFYVYDIQSNKLRVCGLFIVILEPLHFRKVVDQCDEISTVLCIYFFVLFADDIGCLNGLHFMECNFLYENVILSFLLFII